MPFRKPQGRRNGERGDFGNRRKTRQLCSQVARTVEGVLIGELDDEHLRDLIVHAVEPAPDESRLLVTVGPYAPGVRVNPAQVMEHIQAASSKIRAEVAAAITRKRAPNLIYQYAEPSCPEGVPGEP